MLVDRSIIARTGILQAPHRRLPPAVIAAIALSLSVVSGSDLNLGSAVRLDSPSASSNAALAADAYAQGMSYFKAKDYRHAALAFKQAIAQRPTDSVTYYYYALSLHYAKDMTGAKLAYLEILTRFPSSQSASYAQAALASLDPSLMRQMTASPRLRSYSGSSNSGSSSTSGDIIPASSIVNFDSVNNHMVVDVAFNGRRTKAIFDTGAEMILMGKNHMREIGLQTPTGETIARSRGVGGKIEDVWGQRMDVTVGGVTRKNIMVYIQEQMDTLPLLGLPFVQGMNYGVEDNCIRFSAKNTGTAVSSSSTSRGNDYNAVPYTMQGRTMVVHAQVNGKDTPMCLDTGAAGTLFTRAQAAALGINVADEAETLLGSGVGGAVTGRYTTLNSINLGPVQQRDFRVGVSDLSHSPYPLLGKDFWAGRRFSVDEDRHVIHFN